MQYTSIFHDCENVNFQMKNPYVFLYIYFFLLKTLIVGTMSTHNHVLEQKQEKMYTPVNPSFTKSGMLGGLHYTDMFA